MPDRTISGSSSPRFGALHAHRFLFRLGLCLSNAFAWIFVFQYFFARTETIAEALVATALMYCITQVSAIVLTPISASHLRRGVKKSILFASLLAGGAFVYLGATLEGIIGGEPAGWGIAVFALLIGAYRALYWIPYTLEASTDFGDRTRHPLVYEIALAFMPAFAGATLALFPDEPMRIFAGSAAFLALSLIPLHFVRETAENYSWSYIQTFKELLAPRHRTLYTTTFIHGFEGAVLFLMWPIAIFLIVGSDYEVLGAVLSLTLLIVMTLRVLHRRFLSRIGVGESMLVHALLTSSGWLLRLLVATPIGVILADSYSHVSAPKRTHTIDVYTLEQYADQGSYIDEYTALKEIGLGLGRVIAASVFALLLFIVSLPVAFAVIIILAAIGSGMAVAIERAARPTAF